jgi:hypothetical protein
MHMFLSYTCVHTGGCLTVLNMLMVSTKTHAHMHLKLTHTYTRTHTNIHTHSLTLICTHVHATLVCMQRVAPRCSTCWWS